jgi:hypothetical protein
MVIWHVGEFMGRKKSEAARLKTRMDAEDREMEEKGQKPLNRKQALGKYAKYLDG